MRKQNAIPNYFMKNLTRHAEKRGGGRTIEEEKQELPNVGALILECLRESGVDAEKVKAVEREAKAGERIYLLHTAFSENTIHIITGTRKSGSQYAREELAKLTQNILPEGFVLPVGEMPKKLSERAVVYERRAAADITARIYAHACRKVLNCQRNEIDALLEAVKQRYRARSRKA